MKCKTKLRSSTEEYYTARVERKDGKSIVIISVPGTFGAWTYPLETLLCLDGRSSRISNRLYLDWGQSWYVTGIRDLLREIVNNVQ